MKDMSLFPYVPRQGQEELVDFINEAVRESRCAVIESGTGTGKTVCSLVGALEDQKYHGFKILYLTRTKSQQKQVMSEIRQINKKKPVFCVAIQGRTPSTCPMMSGDSELISGTPDELSMWCSNLKSKKTGGCEYYAKMKDVDIERFIRDMREKLPDPEDFQKKCVSMGLCPYEMSKAALKFADVVCAPYAFLLIPHARKPFLEWLEVPLSEIVVITDEAHNIPDYLRDVATAKYTLHALDYVEKEIGVWGDHIVADGLKISDVVNAMRKCFREAISEYLADEDGILPTYFIQEEMMYLLKVTTVTLDGAIRTMIDIGTDIAMQMKKRSKLPRSHIRSLGSFLKFWSECDEMCYVKVINGGENPSLEVFCMDPQGPAEPFRECRSSIHMSGTLEPLEEYAKVMGFDDPMVRTFISPFDPCNLLTLRSENVTTKHEEIERDPKMIERIENELVSVASASVRNTAVFFPSYDMMGRFIADGVPGRFGREVYFEKRGMPQNDLMDVVENFKTSEGSILFAVSGGRVSEGLDFPDKDLEIAVIIGIPYPYPTLKLDALIRYSDMMFGNGWDHAVKTPAIRKMRQARGRLIRSETDRGVCVVLDSRISAIQGFDSEISENIASSIRNFFYE